MVQDKSKKDLEMGPIEGLRNLSGDSDSQDTEQVGTVHPIKFLTSLRSAEAWLDMRLGVEARGAELIPEEEKNPPLMANMFFLWWSLVIHIGLLPLGLLGPQMGLNLKDSISASILGTWLGAFCTAFSATLGPKLGLRQIATSRYSFGFYGAYLTSFLNIIVGGGFVVINFVVVGQLLSAVSGYEMSIVVGIIIVGVISFALSIFGFGLLHTWERYSWIGTVILFIVLYAQVSPYVGVDTPGSTTGHGLLNAGVYLSVFSVNFSNSGAWCSLASDYYCNYSAKTPAWKTFFMTYFGVSVPTTFLITLGILLGNAAVTMPTAGNPNPLSEGYNDRFTGNFGGLILAAYHPTAFAKFCAVILAFSVLGNNIAVLYSIGLSMQLYGGYFQTVPRFIWSIIASIITVVLAAVGKQQLSSVVHHFVALIGYWAISFSVILFMEDVCFRRLSGYDLSVWNVPSKLPVGAAATIALLAGYLAGGVPGMAQEWFVGPVALKFGPAGGDVGIFLSAAITAVFYAPLRYLEKRHFRR